MFLSLNIETLLIAPPLRATGSLSRVKSLKFSQDSDSYIQLYPNWSPLLIAISVCGRIRDLGSASYPTVFTCHHNHTELVMMTDGRYTGIFSSTRHFRTKFSVSKDTWYHMCVTWSESSRTLRYYVNGQELLASGRSLRTSGEGSGWWFGGQMAYLNFYAKELSASEVARMVREGMCSNIAAADEHECRVFSCYKIWEIVTVERNGTVTDLYVGQRVEDTECRLNETAEELKETLVEKDKMEEEISTKLNVTLAELKEISTNLNRTWDIFLSGQFLNNTFSTEHLELLRSSWGGVAERLVEIRMTDEFVKLSDHMDPVRERETVVNVVF